MKIEIIFDREHGRRNRGWFARTTDAQGQEEDCQLDTLWSKDARVPESTIRAWAATYYDVDGADILIFGGAR